MSQGHNREFYAPLADIQKPASERLADELRAFTSGLIEPDWLALYRFIVADGWRFPDPARVFDQSGMRVIRRRFAELLETGGVPATRSRQAAGEGCLRKPRHTGGSSRLRSRFIAGCL
ncbi:MAG: TetR/AcrR family transcriptional regulator C-terminal domain-containing protein [Steroidobacteraceae bacterium]